MACRDVAAGKTKEEKMNWESLLNWLVDRLGESSTWRGIIGLVTAAGIVIDPERATQIIAGGMTIVGLINVFRKAPPTKQAVAIAVNTGNTEHLVKPVAETENKP